MKTHLVIDLEDECNTCYVGSYVDCHNWIALQGGFSFTLQVVPMTETEMVFYNSKT